MTPVHAPIASFYDEVLRELITALGAALFLGNLWALIRRSHDADRVAARTVERGRPGSPVRSPARPGERRELAQAPVARTVAYMVLGFVVMIAGIASIVAM